MKIQNKLFFSLIGLAFLAIAGQNAEAQNRHGGGGRGNGGGRGGNDNSGYGYSYIRSNVSVCYANGRDLCTAYLNWSTGRYGNGGAVVTVTSRNEGREKVYACNDNGTGDASWIAPGDSYVFKLYASDNCDSSVGRWSQPVAEVSIQGAR